MMNSNIGKPSVKFHFVCKLDIGQRFFSVFRSAFLNKNVLRDVVR
jgi:hypothetical protein